MPLLIMILTISLSVASIEIFTDNDPLLTMSLSMYGKPNDLRVLYSTDGGAEANTAGQKYHELIASTARISKVSITLQVVSIAVCYVCIIMLNLYSHFDHA